VYGIRVIEGDSMAEVSKSLKEAITSRKPDESKAPVEGKGKGN